MKAVRAPYLLERQRDLPRMKRLAFEEFVKALNSGRMIALVGSYASKHLGYPDWTEMVQSFLTGCSKGTLNQQLLQHLQVRAGANDPQFAATDIMDMGELLAGRDRHADFNQFEDDREEFAKLFKFQGAVADALDRPRVAGALLSSLNINRFVTLNYDLELEWEAFLTEHSRVAIKGLDRQTEWETLVPDLGERLLEREVTGRGRVTSEVPPRKDSAQLIDFALGTPDDDGRRILHLHGRVDRPSSMLVTRRDYRDRYWQSGFSKLPFEYGLRLIFSGNPILFIGIGMSEFEVTRSLEQVLSDNPNRRMVPMFLLWKSVDQDTDDATRLLFNRKFGIHVLFDYEIAEHHGGYNRIQYLKRVDAPLSQPPVSMPAVDPVILKDARRLEEPLRLLGEIAESEKGAHFWQLDDLRDPQAKYSQAGHRVNIWHYLRRKPPKLERNGGTNTRGKPLARLTGVRAGAALVKALSDRQSVKVLIGDPGSRRGAIASVLGGAYEAAYRRKKSGRVVVVNGSFATDTDSIFSILSGAFDGETARKAGISRAASARLLREQINKQLQEQHGRPNVPGRELTLIINGMERFFAHDGSSLSTELDYLIRFVFTAEAEYRRWRDYLIEKKLPPAPPFPLRLILIGTARLQRYLSIVAPDHHEIRIRSDAKAGVSSFTLGTKGEYVFSVSNEAYFAQLQRHFSSAAIPVEGDRAARRRRFFANLLDSMSQPTSGITDPDLAFKILTILAFIGQPTEEHVLRHIRSLWGGANSLTPICRNKIQQTVKELVDKDLLLRIERFPTHTVVRLGLHKALIMELRHRHGVPVSEAKLATGFNIGLYTAQPVDAFTPDQRWHQDIGEMVDFLVGQYKDRQRVNPRINEAAKKLLSTGKTLRTKLHGLDERMLARLASPAMADCLRAALSLMRSYYSTPALLMFGNRDLDPWNRDGPLTEHADRLRRILRTARIVALARRLVANELRKKKVAEAEIARILGPASFYPDDLVWLNNELGVVLTTQGSLYEARTALEEARFINDQYLDFGERHQNWRRISMNMVQLDIDGGLIESAEERLRDIESALEDEAAEMPQPPAQYVGGYLGANFSTLRDYVIAVYAHGGCSGRVGRVDSYYPTNLILGIALVLGYQGLCQHLRGALEPAEELFKDSVAILERLQENRAYAFFQRHRAALYAASKKLKEAEEALRLCVAAAGPTRQTDIDHSGRIALANEGILIPSADGKDSGRHIIPQLSETLRYATTSDMFRLQLEAMASMAGAHLRHGDADSAMMFATDALAIASRCGFGLRKVTLRILFGRILAFNRDRESGRKLVTIASDVATKLGYHSAVQSAEDALVQMQ